MEYKPRQDLLHLEKGMELYSHFFFQADDGDLVGYFSKYPVIIQPVQWTVTRDNQWLISDSYL